LKSPSIRVLRAFAAATIPREFYVTKAAPIVGSEVWPGKAYPLGATYDGSGTNFAVFSEVAEKVELCLFDADGHESRVTLNDVDGFVWHGFVPGTPEEMTAVIEKLLAEPKPAVAAF